MARKAREKYEQGKFLISQNGNVDNPIFRDDTDRQKFLEILEKNRDKFKFHLLAYCIGSGEHYDVVIDLNGSDLSKIMKSVNIAYAIHRKSETKLFKDRYKSAYLKTEDEIKRVIEEIEQRKPCNDNCEETFNQWKVCYDQIINVKEDISFEDCDFCINCLEQARDKLNHMALKESITIESLIEDKDKRNELIKSFRKYSTLSMKDIGELFGGLSESSICKIINC